MLKHCIFCILPHRFSQPPSGGCVLKLNGKTTNALSNIQPPSGGCVLKRQIEDNKLDDPDQPPSGGCVLKHPYSRLYAQTYPAAFRRLCVET